MFGIILFAIVLLYFVYRGYRLGLGLVLARIASLVGAYILTLMYSATLATKLSEHSELDGLGGYFLSAIGIFILASIFISIVLRIVLHSLGKLTERKSKLAIPGAIANGIIGVYIGLAIVWVANMAYTAINNGKLPEDNLVNHYSQTLIGGSIDSILSKQFPQAPQMVGVASYALKNPAQSVKDGIYLANDKDVQRLVNSKKISRMVAKKDVLGLMVAPEINAVLDDKTVQRILEGTHVLGDVDVTDKTAVKMKLTEEVMTTLARVELVKHNPRFKQLSKDPEVNRMIRKNDVMGLLNSPKVKEMAQIVMDSGIIK